MNLPIEVIDNIVSFVMIDRLMYSPTAKIMKSYFIDFKWDVHEFIHDLVRSQSGIHSYEMRQILNSTAWLKEHVLNHIHLYRQLMKFYIDVEFWELEIIEWILSNTLLKLAIYDNCPSLNNKSSTRIIDFCMCSKNYWYINQYYKKLASDHQWENNITPF